MLALMRSLGQYVTIGERFVVVCSRISHHCVGVIILDRQLAALPPVKININLNESYELAPGIELKYIRQESAEHACIGFTAPFNLRILRDNPACQQLVKDKMQELHSSDATDVA